MNANTLQSLAIRSIRFFALSMGLLSMGLLALTACADDWPDLVLPENTHAVVVADRIDINRLPTRIWRISSARRPDQFLAFYRQHWTTPPQKDAPPFIENTAGPWRIISRAEKGFLITVQVDKTDATRSEGMFSVAQLDGAMVEKAMTGKLPEYPRMSGSKVLQELNNHDAGKNALTVVLENAHSPASNRDYYKKYYESRGWVEIKTRAQSSGSTVLLLQKGPLETSYTFVSRDGKTQVVGAIQYVES